MPGDGLATRLSDALSQSRVVIVVVTPNSIDFRWFRFELNKATERMVQGNCRIIPALKGKVEPPSELKGLVYADFRRSFKKGLEAVLAALSKEADAVVIGSWRELECFVEETFDNHGFASVSVVSVFCMRRFISRTIYSKWKLR